MDIRYQIMREIVANMEVHADYGIGYACFMGIFKDRVITKNPTRLLPNVKEGDVTVEELGNYTKNPLLVKVFGELGWVEDLGSGMRNIFHYAPLYYNDYEIDIQNNRQFEFSITYSDAGLGSTTQTTTQTTNRDLVLQYISEHPTASRREIAERIDNLTSDGVKYILSKLQKEGIVKRIGAKFGGHWEIIK